MTRPARRRPQWLTSTAVIEQIETKLTLMLWLLGVMIAVMLGGFYSVWAQLVAMSAKIGA